MKYAFTDDNKFECYFDYSLKGKIKSFKEEVKDHFKKIVGDYNSVYLLFSGGMDSRFMALILLELEIDFTAITYGFKEDFTDYDSKVSTEFAKEHGFKHELFYLDKNEVSKCVSDYHKEKFFVPILNSYYILSAVKRYYKTGSVFLTGACSEFKIQNGKVDIPWNFLTYKEKHYYLYNFTTDRIFFSYFDEPVIKNNWANKSLNMFDARDKLYNQIYSDKLNIIKKRTPDDNIIRDYFYNVIINQYKKYYPKLFSRTNFIVDLENHYKKWENT
jgi:hypothetical protein